MWVCRCDAPCKYCETNHIHKVSSKDILKTKACKRCQVKTQRGPSKIIALLEKNNIQYKREYTFQDCKDKRELPFDFYLPNYNTLIEYDGEQHFYPIEAFGGEKDFLIRQKHDAMKNAYCLQNKITLIRIPYTHLDDIVLEDLLPTTSSFIIEE